jgi:pyruvate carboxylase
VAVFPFEDRNAIHRIKADEAYLIGERGHPVRAYLDINEIMRAAKESDADAIYPGYGFLSENPELARACADVGITFIGPPAKVLELAGNKVRAIEAARAAGVPTLKSTPPSADLDELTEAAEAIGFPVFVKAVAGGGGRGMRRVADPEQLREAIGAAMREAEGAFGDPTAYIEQAVGRPRHIEAQVLADTHGNTIHLFERDCSVQRRHQKIVEIAPAPHISTELREALCRRRGAVRRVDQLLQCGHRRIPGGNRRGACRSARLHRDESADPGRAHHHRGDHRRRSCAGSDAALQAGESLADLDLSQEVIRINGAALQCRITTEDPANDFRPDTGTITAYRSAGGAGVRIDGGTVDIGVEISAYFDSLLVKLICHGRDFESAVARARRAACEIPDSRREHQHSFPASGSGRSGLYCWRCFDVLHRGAFLTY